jgi:PAS domain S-box-containing protein
MKKSALIIIGIMACAIWCQPFISNASETIKVGVFQNRPLLFRDRDGIVKGIFADILSYTANKEDWVIEYVDGDWTQCLEGLKSENLDLIGAIAYTNDRNRFFDFTWESALTNWGQIYVHSSSDIESILDLKGKKVAVLHNDVYYRGLRKLVAQFEIDCRFIEAYEYDAVFELVEMGRCDAGLVGYLYGHQHERDYDVYKTSIILNPQRVHFAVPKSRNMELIDALDQHLRVLKRNKNSIYYKSLSRWIGSDTKVLDIKWLLGLSAGGVGLLVAFLIINFVLRYQVKSRTRQLDSKNKALIKEIEHRKKVETALYNNEKEYRVVFENTGTATIIIEEDMVISKVNAMVEEMTGCSKADLEGRMTLADFVASENLNRIIACHTDRERNIRYLRSENTFKLKDKQGNPKNVFIQISLIPGTKRRIASLIDITSRVQAEAALRRSEEKYRNIIENIEEGYFELDLKGNLTFFNNSLCRITGRSKNEIAGMNYREYSNENTSKKMFEVFHQIYLTGESIGVADFEINLLDGRKITIDLSASPIKDTDANGKVIGFRGILRDVTERKKTEQERLSLERKLQLAEKMEVIGTLAGGVAHDLNNILSGIVSYPELLLMELPKDSPLVAPIQMIQSSGKKAAAIVQDLLTLARRGVPTSDILNLNVLIEEYLKSPELEKLKSFHPSVKLETQLTPSLLNIMGSPVHLSKTIMNLISNASEAMPDGGKILIKTCHQYIKQPISGYNSVKEGNYAVLIVSDNGIGIPADEIGAIFEPFYTKKVMGRSGTGLGMTVVRGTVKDHKGYIQVDSRPGKGTSFRLYFPITRQKREKDVTSTTIKDYRGRGESILVVDDVEEQREIASQILSQLGYTVNAVSSGEEAIQYVQTHLLDLLVLDMIMPPGMDGLETYKQIVAINPNQKAIIASGFSETDRVREAQRLGAGEYVRKPYTIDKIALAVKREITKRAA